MTSAAAASVVKPSCTRASTGTRRRLPGSGADRTNGTQNCVCASGNANRGGMTPSTDTTLFAALNVLTGKVIGQCHGRHRHQEFLKFLRRLDRAFPPDLTLHVMLDNYGTHKHEAVRSGWPPTRGFSCTSGRPALHGST